MLLNYIKYYKIPRRINTKEQLNLFWEGFDALKMEMNRREMPSPTLALFCPFPQPMR